MHGVIEREITDTSNRVIRFACPFVQKRLFNFFSNQLFGTIGQVVEPFTNLDHVISRNRLDIGNLAALYQSYLNKNKSWLFKNAPRRSDLKVFEAVYHFNLYSYIAEFLRNRNGSVFPEFPTGNGKIDLLLQYKDQTYGLELKSFTDKAGYGHALKQAAHYGRQLNLKEMHILFFIPAIDEKNRKELETVHVDQETGLKVIPLLIETGD